MADRRKKVYVMAGVVDGHSRRLRDTFSVDLLQKGVSLETVSMLLGHTSIGHRKSLFALGEDASDALEDAVKLSWTS